MQLKPKLSRRLKYTQRQTGYRGNRIYNYPKRVSYTSVVEGKLLSYTMKYFNFFAFRMTITNPDDRINYI